MELLVINNFFSDVLSGNIGLILAAFISIFSVANPFGTLPIFNSLTEDKTSLQRAKIAKRSSIYMFAILTVFFISSELYY